MRALARAGAGTARQGASRVVRELNQQAEFPHNRDTAGGGVL